MAVLAPMPSASVRMATAANPGLLAKVRQPYRRSWNTDDMRHPLAACRWTPDSLSLDGFGRKTVASGADDEGQRGLVENPEAPQKAPAPRSRRQGGCGARTPRRQPDVFLSVEASRTFETDQEYAIRIVRLAVRT